MRGTLVPWGSHFIGSEAAASGGVTRYARRSRFLAMHIGALSLVDPGAESPVHDSYGALTAVLDMGWEDVKLAVEYEGELGAPPACGGHRTDRRQFNRDIRRAEAVAELGWIDVRVTAEDTPRGIIARVSAAWQRRTCTQCEKP